MELSSVGVTTVATITVICFFVAEVIKITPLNNKWIPTICGILGGILGPVAMRTVPNFPASDMFTAVSVGIISGLSATGVHQTYKQLTRKE